MMTTVEYLKAKKRMCDRYIDSAPTCEGCPLDNPDCTGCLDYEETCLEEVIEKVEKWAKENPEETILSDFLKKYPNAELTSGGWPLFCCEHLFKREHSNSLCSPVQSCKKCWSRPLSEVQK